ncbi:MAG: DNA-3-methyladenine glycosylase 2 [Ruminococcaceae bacterium]|nr:DNA-3-methyladenine glycosylase 2 [Oscillospiraceae bacterium]
MKVIFKNGNTYLEDVENFDIAATLDCGQAFRWETDGSRWYGVAFDRELTLEKIDDTIILYNTTEKDFNEIWYNYFDLDRNYAEIIKQLSTDSRFIEPCKFGSGIRLLNQSPWETLCSFIISQNNNIPRIKGIIDRLCSNFGEKRDGFYTFPTPQAIAEKSVEELAVLRAGFRAKYILDAAKKVSSGEIDLEAVKKLSCDEARQVLMRICGVGPKVADCTLLFGLGFTEAFPKDVWIKRIMERDFGGVLPECAIPFAGIAQQYLFFYARSHSETF